MKKFAALLLVLIMALSLAACGGAAETPAETPSGDAQPAATEEPAPAESETLVTDGVSFTVPEDFEESTLEGADVCYSAADKSSVTVMSDVSDPNFSSITAEALETSVASGIKGSTGVDAEITTNDFQFVEVDGAPAYYWDATITLSGVTLHELLVGINADSSYAVTYTDASADGSHMDSFYESANAITLNRVAA